MIWGLHGTPGGFLAPSWKQVPKKTSKRQIAQSCFGSYLGSFLGPNRFFLYLLRVNFYACFGIASGRPPVAILKILGLSRVFWGHIAHLFADAAKLKNCNLSSEMLGLGGAGRPFLHYFCWLFECVFDVAV